MTGQWPAGFDAEERSPLPSPAMADDPPACPPLSKTTLFVAAARPARLALTRLVALVYPPVCVACRAATGEAQALCAHCWGEIGFIERPYCERLGTPFAVDLGPGLLSPAAIADPPVFARARAVCRFEGAARELVHRLKYGDRTELALTLGRMMVQAGRELIAEADLIVPVPLHRMRLWSRRFNQAALLAAAVARLTALPSAPAALARMRRTRRQVGLTRAQRADNLQGAFRVPDSARPLLEGRRILLVDDVLTTGATANAASRALLRGGARQVDLLTFARVVTDG